MSEKRKYTELQQRFLDVVLDDVHRGNIRAAMKTAGYADTVSTSVVVNSLSDELIDIAKRVVASQAIRATFATIDVMDSPADLGAANKLKAAQTLLDRAGIKSKDESVDLKIPSGGLVILPAKEYDRDRSDTEKVD